MATILMIVGVIITASFIDLSIGLLATLASDAVGAIRHLGKGHSDDTNRNPPARWRGEGLRLARRRHRRVLPELPLNPFA